MKLSRPILVLLALAGAAHASPSAEVPREQVAAAGMTKQELFRAIEEAMPFPVTAIRAGVTGGERVFVVSLSLAGTKSGAPFMRVSFRVPVAAGREEMMQAIQAAATGCRQSQP